MLRPFIRYYGGKWRAAPLYPAPKHDTIIEPFAGAAGYAMRHHRRNVVLVEKYAPLAEMWRWLIAVKPREVLAIPTVESVDDLPAGTAQGARVLVGFLMVSATHHPAKTLAAATRKRMGERRAQGWGTYMRALVAAQVEQIRHWMIIEGDYTCAPDVEATYFIDPPYNNKAGSCYPRSSKQIDYAQLGQWCQQRRGQVIVCENEGADWLPFRPMARLRRGLNKDSGSREAIWTNEPMGQGELFTP